MEISYTDFNIRNLCENEEESLKEFGPSISEILKNRLADLSAADNFSDLPHVNFYKIQDKPVQFKIKLLDNFELIFCSGHLDTPLLSNGDLDFKKISRIKIIKIGK